MIIEESIEAYHESDAVSHSGLRDLAEHGPRGYWERWISRTADRRVTEALTNGQAFELYLCDRTAFNRIYAVKPEGHDGRTKEGKAWNAEQAAAGRIVLERKDVEAFVYMRQNIHANGRAMQLIVGVAQQRTMRCDWLGLPGLQSRPDWLNTLGYIGGGRPYAVDLKTCDNLNKLVNGKAVANYGYHSQAGLARIVAANEGIEDLAWHLIAIEKQWPWRCQVIDLSEDFLAAGEAWCMRQMADLARHYESGEWPLVESESTTAYPPAWVDVPATGNPKWLNTEVA